MTHDTRASKLLAVLFATVAIVAACSSGGGGATTAPSAAAPSASASEAAPSASEAAPSESASASASAAGGAVQLTLATGALGKFLTDGTGKTLYMFTPDEDQAAPTCNDQCAASWPPLTASAASDVTVGEGLDQSKVKLEDRADGTKQVVYGDYPLYYFAKDSASGQTNGQGLNSKWYVVGGDGEPIKS